MADNKKWSFREDMLGHYINGVSCRTFRDAENRLNQLEEAQTKLKAGIRKITFRVFETATNNDVTDQYDWFIDLNGDLYFGTTDIDSPLALGDDYYYEVTLG